MRLRNGGGRPEVLAAHIVPVSEGASDATTNGLALSGTVHWMFDRGRISVAEDGGILISRNKVPSDVAHRIIAPGHRLIAPRSPHDQPHAEYLAWHRENRFGQFDPETEGSGLPW